MAIATDAVSKGFDNGNPTATSMTVSHTCTGTNLILIVGVHTYSTAGVDIVSGVTYIKGGSATAMTRLNIKNFGTQQNIYYYYMLAPDTGANNIVVSLTTGSLFGIFFVEGSSYTGVSQSGFPDAQSSGSAASNADIVGTVVTVADNSWPVMLTGSDDNASATAGSGTTIRVSSSTAASPNRDAIADSNTPKTPAGSTSLTVTPSATTAATAYIIASLAPVGAATATTVVPTLPLLMVG